jgi:hypothetical protein
MELNQKTIEELKRFLNSKAWEQIREYMNNNAPVCFTIPETQEQIVKLSHTMSKLAGYKEYENSLTKIIEE